MICGWFLKAKILLLLLSDRFYIYHPASSSVVMKIPLRTIELNKVLEKSDEAREKTKNHLKAVSKIFHFFHNNFFRRFGAK